MGLLKTMTFFSDVGSGMLFRVDTIEHDGKMWLVPEWLDNPREGWRKPARIVCVDGMSHQRTMAGPTDFVLNTGIAKAVFQGHNQSEEEMRFLVIEGPDIRFPAIGG
jgi:hypothetical protein